MTQPNELLPASAFNYTSIAALASRTKADWEAVWAGGIIPATVNTFIDFLTGFDDLLAESGLEEATGLLIRNAFSGPLGSIIDPIVSELVEAVTDILDFLDLFNPFD